MRRGRGGGRSGWRRALPEPSRCGRRGVRPQEFPQACAVALGDRITIDVATEIGHQYSELASTLSDVRGSAAYRKRMIAVLVRRSLETLAA